MAKQNKPTPRNKSKNSTPPKNAAKGSNVKDQPNPNSQSDDGSYIQYEPPNVYVNIPQVKEEKWSYANKIAAAMGVITLTLTIFTYLLFDKAGDQATAAIRASNDADSVLAETKREFNIINEPYIQIIPDSIKLKDFAVGKRIGVDYWVASLKDVTSKLISSQTLFAANSGLPNLDSLKEGLGFIINLGKPNVNEYITKQTPVFVHGRSAETMTAGQLGYLLNPGNHLYVAVMIKFQNLITGDYKYSFVVIQNTFYKNGNAYSNIIKNEIN